MLELSRNQKIALALVAFPSAALLIYLLLKEENDENEEKKADIVTSRVTVIEVKVPSKVVGAVIGRQGENIKMVQEKSGARINFNDPKQHEADRTCVISGTPQSAADAERLVRKLMACRAAIQQVKMYIPKTAVGRIIGKGGDTIRYLCSTSGAKINVSRSNSYDDEVLVTIQGTPETIENAKGLLAEKVSESEAFLAKAAMLTANRQLRGRKRTEEDKRKTTQNEEFLNVQASIDTPCCTVEPIPDVFDYFSVFVSAVSSPDVFWIQLLRSQNMQLDPLVQRMTDYYRVTQHTPLEVLNVGDIVASPFPHDDLWYRARVIQLLPDDVVDLYFVDYGDSEHVHRNELQQLGPDFLNLPFQAIECRLAGVQSKDGTWSDKAIETFEQLTHVAQWKVINAKVTGYHGDTPLLELVDTNGLQDIHINEEMVREGCAVYPTENGEPASEHKQQQKEDG